MIYPCFANKSKYTVYSIHIYIYIRKPPKNRQKKTFHRLKTQIRCVGSKGSATTLKEPKTCKSKAKLGGGDQSSIDPASCFFDVGIVSVGFFSVP